MENNFTIVPIEKLQLLLDKIDKLEQMIQDQPGSSKPIYTEKEVADMFGVTVKTMSTYRNQGFISFVKPTDSRTILYTKEHINEFCKKYEWKAFKK